MEDRKVEDHTVDPPEIDRQNPTAVPPEMEQRPLGALAITGFLVVVILVMWFGMYFLNIVRN